MQRFAEHTCKQALVAMALQLWTFQCTMLVLWQRRLRANLTELSSRYARQDVGSRYNAASPIGKCHLQAEELTAHSEKRMKELEKEIQDCERAMVSSK